MDKGNHEDRKSENVSINLMYSFTEEMLGD